MMAEEAAEYSNSSTANALLKSEMYVLDKVDIPAIKLSCRDIAKPQSRQDEHSDLFLSYYCQ